MTEDRAGAPSEPSPAAARAAAPAGAAGTLEALVGIARTAADPAGAAMAIVEALAASLGLARVRLLVSRICADGVTPCLEPLASAGSHAALTRDMPSLPMDGSTDLARVAETGVPEFHGDVHGLGERGDTERTGLGRWRSGVTTQASAVVPLALRDSVIGVLSMEWAVPRPFDLPERTELAILADVSALVLASFLAEESAAVPAPAPQGCTPAPTASLAVTRDGIVVPAGTPGAWAAAPALRVHVGAAAQAPGTDTEDVFWDVIGVRGGLVVVTLGLASTPRGGAAEVAETARHMLRASTLQGAGPARGLALLAGWLSASGPGSAWISALACEIDVRRASASWCAAGNVALVTRYTDGRFDAIGAEYPPLGGTVAADFDDRDLLLLPGDRLALVCGEISALTHGRGRDNAARALAQPGQSGAQQAIPVLMDMLRAHSVAEGALVLDVEE